MSLIFSTDFRKNPQIQNFMNPSNGKRVDLCGQTDARVDMTKIIDAIFQNALTNAVFYQHSVFLFRLNQLLCPVQN
jgi:hypothetical protein